MIKCPTWSELIEQLSEHGIVFHESEEILQAPDGEQEKIKYFECGAAHYVVCFCDSNERVVPSQIRSICAAFNIDVAKFWLIRPEWATRILRP
jgi:hypothetical protein